MGVNMKSLGLVKHRSQVWGQVVLSPAIGTGVGPGRGRTKLVSNNVMHGHGHNFVRAGGCPLYIAWTRRHTNVPKLIIDKTPTFTTFVVYPLFIHALYKTERLQIFGMCWKESQFVSI